MAEIKDMPVGVKTSKKPPQKLRAGGMSKKKEKRGHKHK